MNKKIIILSLTFMILLVSNVAAVNITNMSEEEFKTEVQKFMKAGINATNSTNELNDFIDYINTWPAEISQDKKILDAIEAKKTELEKEEKPIFSRKVKIGSGIGAAVFVVAIALYLLVFKGKAAKPKVTRAEEAVEKRAEQAEKEVARLERLEEEAKKRIGNFIAELDNIMSLKLGRIEDNQICVEPLIDEVKGEKEFEVDKEGIENFLQPIYDEIERVYPLKKGEGKQQLLTEIKGDIKKDILISNFRVAEIDKRSLKRIEQLLEHIEKIREGESLEAVAREIIGVERIILARFKDNIINLISDQNHLKRILHSSLSLNKKEERGLRKLANLEVVEEEEIKKLISELNKAKPGQAAVLREKHYLTHINYAQSLLKKEEEIEEEIKIILQRFNSLHKHFYIPLKEKISEIIRIGDSFDEIEDDITKLSKPPAEKEINQITNNLSKWMTELTSKFEEEKKLIDDLRIEETKLHKNLKDHLIYLSEEESGEAATGPAGGR